MTEAVFAVVETRLQQQHRLLVATCFGLARLNMAYEEEDYIKAFLVPLNLDQGWLWEEVIPPDKKEKEAEVDGEEKEEVEDKEEKDIEEGKDNEKEKGKEEKEVKSEEEDLEIKTCETVEGKKEQTDETFPSWIPKECNIKVCIVHFNS